VTLSGLAGGEYLPLPASKGLAFPFLLTLDGYPTSPAIYAQGQRFSPKIKKFQEIHGRLRLPGRYELSEVCRVHNVRIIYDGAHVLGLIAGKRFEDPLNAHDHPEGIRIGAQEMTRFGMGEEEMVRIAELIKECVIENKSVKEEVNRFRSEYQEVKYSFDELVQEKPELVEIKAT